jgi:hypothetical protein
VKPQISNETPITGPKSNVPSDVQALIRTLNTSENIQPRAEGGIVTRPLLGEAGPEAVIPLKKGMGLKEIHFHVHGNVYGIDQLENMFGKAIDQYERSQRT